MRKQNEIPRYYQAHPLMIFTFIKPYIFILFIPLLQGIINYLNTKKLTALIIGEIIAAAVIFMLAVIRYRRCRIYLTQSSVCIKYGIILMHEFTIPVNKISTTLIKTGPILALCRAVEIRLNTEAGTKSKADCRIIIPTSVSPDFNEILPTDLGNTFHFKTPAPRLLIMTAATSNAAVGLLVAAPIVWNGGRLISEGIRNRLLDTLSDAVEVAGSLAGNLIPPLATMLTIAVLFGFIFSFVQSLFKNIPFEMHRKGERITVTAGTVMRRRSTFHVRGINNITIMQNPIMMLLKRYNVKVSVAGYGDARGETATVIPAARSSELYDFATALLPHFRRSAPTIKHAQSTLLNFLTMPTIFMCLLPVMAAILTKIFPYFSDLFWFLALVGELLDIFLFIISVRKHQRGGITIGDDFCAFGSRFFNIAEFHCEKEKIGCIRITRYPWDKLTGLCHVKLSAREVSGEHQTVNFLDARQVNNAVNSFYNLY